MKNRGPVKRWLAFGALLFRTNFGLVENGTGRRILLKHYFKERRARVNEERAGIREETRKTEYG